LDAQDLAIRWIMQTHWELDPHELKRRNGVIEDAVAWKAICDEDSRESLHDRTQEKSCIACETRRVKTKGDN